jgi:choline dehydrogenase-like flavoprotein
MSSRMYDVAITGGGPAGSTAAGLLARAPRNVLGLAPAVNAVLGGNVGNSFPIRWRMWVFYFLVWFQRHHPTAPRLALVPRKEEAPAPMDAVRTAS